jgi:hypothetical protein
LGIQNVEVVSSISIPLALAIFGWGLSAKRGHPLAVDNVGWRKGEKRIFVYDPTRGWLLSCFWSLVIWHIFSVVFHIGWNIGGSKIYFTLGRGN